MSDYLFASSSFAEGMGSCLDLFGTSDSYNESGLPHQADFRAILSDWLTVARDLIGAAKPVTAKWRGSRSLGGHL